MANTVKVGSYFEAKCDQEKYLIAGQVINNNSLGRCYLLNLRTGFLVHGPVDVANVHDISEGEVKMLLMNTPELFNPVEHVVEHYNSIPKDVR